MGVNASRTAVKTLKHCTLWKSDRSPACRAVMMALDAMNLSVNEVDVNLDKGEHRAPDMMVMNPHQTVPVFKDRELILHDSHAINTYLANRYCDCELLPCDPGGRALVEQLLHYDSSVLYPRYHCITYPIFYQHCRYIMPQHMSDIECSYSDLENRLGNRVYLTGCWPTLGDISIAATISTMNILVPIDSKRYPKLSSWLYRMAEQPYYITANKKGLVDFTNRLGDSLQKSKFKINQKNVI